MRRPKGDFLIFIYIRDHLILRLVGFITPFTGVRSFATGSKWCRRVKIGRMSDVSKLHWFDHLVIVVLPPVIKTKKIKAMMWDPLPRRGKNMKKYSSDLL